MDHETHGVTVLRSPPDRSHQTWITTTTRGHTITWHNGSTAAARTILAIDRASCVAVLVFVASGVVRLIRATSRLHVLSGLSDLVGGCVLLAPLGPWSYVPGWTYGMLLGPAVWFAVVGVRRARRLPCVPERRPVLAWLGTAVNLLIAGAVVALVL